MLSAVIVDDPETNIHLGNVNKESGGTTIPLLDLSDNLTILTRTGTSFPTTVSISPDDPLIGLVTSLVKTFYAITDPSNWKDYTQDTWNVNLPPAPLTTNNNDVWIFLVDGDTVGTIAGLTAPSNPDTGTVASTILPLGLDSSMPISADIPRVSGIGEVWVNTQFEATVGKNLLGTHADKPGTITVVNADDWSIERKLALPELGNERSTEIGHEFGYEPPPQSLGRRQKRGNLPDPVV